MPSNDVSSPRSTSNPSKSASCEFLMPKTSHRCRNRSTYSSSRLIHSLQTDARYFADPLSFAPERWTAQPDLVHDRRAFHPFLVGPYNCVGQRLARRFVRLALASTLWAYDVEFAPGEDGRAIHEQAINRLLLKPGPLWCVFKKRGGQEASQI